MQREKLGGGSLIAAAVLGLITMAFHPTGRSIAADPGLQGALNVAVHSLAIATTPLGLYGAFALTRRLSAQGELSELAFAFYAVAAVATLMAASASGLIGPAITETGSGNLAEMQLTSDALRHYTYTVNQAFAKILVGASSVAIGLWSADIVRTRLLRPRTGIYGIVAAVIILIVLLSGRLRFDVHGFGAVVLIQALWMIMVGAELRRAHPASTAG